MAMEHCRRPTIARRDSAESRRGALSPRQTRYLRLASDATDLQGFTARLGPNWVGQAGFGQRAGCSSGPEGPWLVRHSARGKRPPGPLVTRGRQPRGVEKADSGRGPGIAAGRNQRERNGRGSFSEPRFPDRSLPGQGAVQNLIALRFGNGPARAGCEPFLVWART